MDSTVEVKLLANGRYTWKINLIYHGQPSVTASEIKQIDTQLKDKFPDHVTRGTGRAVNIEDGD